MAGRGCGRQGVHTARAHACASVAREGCRRDRPRRRDWPGTSLEISLFVGSEAFLFIPGGEGNRESLGIPPTARNHPHAGGGETYRRARSTRWGIPPVR